MTAHAHTVSVENTFHGPLDLLLYLVRRDEIDIHDIPVSHLTSEYMAEIDRMKELDVELASDFLAVASMLLEIKSRMLLPPIETEAAEEEEDPLVDPRTGLVQALLEYKRFKEAAAALGMLAEEHAKRFARIAPIPEFDPEEGDSEGIETGSSLDLLVAFQKMVRALSASAQEIVNDEIPTEVRVEMIERRLARDKQFTFSSLLSAAPTKGEMVGYFIAILELIRLRKLWAEQSADFSEIHIIRRDATTEKQPARRLAALPFTQEEWLVLRPHAAARGLFAPLGKTRLVAARSRTSIINRTGAFPPVVCRQATRKAATISARTGFLPVPPRPRRKTDKKLLLLNQYLPGQTAAQPEEHGQTVEPQNGGAARPASADVAPKPQAGEHTGGRSGRPAILRCRLTAKRAAATPRPSRCGVFLCGFHVRTIRTANIAAQTDKGRATNLGFLPVPGKAVSRFLAVTATMTAKQAVRFFVLLAGRDPRPYKKDADQAASLPSQAPRKTPPAAEQGHGNAEARSSTGTPCVSSRRSGGLRHPSSSTCNGFPPAVLTTATRKTGGDKRTLTVSGFPVPVHRKPCPRNTATRRIARLF